MLVELLVAIGHRHRGIISLRMSAARRAINLIYWPSVAAISSIEFTRKPVIPSTTTSGIPPRRNATTGVPQAAASMATSELVSSARLGIRTARALCSSRASVSAWVIRQRKCRNTVYPLRYVEMWQDFPLKILLMIRKRIDRSGKHKPHPRPSSGLDSQVRAFLFAETTQPQKVVLFHVRVALAPIKSLADFERIKILELNPVRHDLHHARQIAKRTRLGTRTQLKDKLVGTL